MTAAQLERNSQNSSHHFKKLTSYRKRLQANKAAFNKFHAVKHKFAPKVEAEESPEEKPKANLYSSYYTGGTATTALRDWGTSGSITLGNNIQWSTTASTGAVYSIASTGNSYTMPGVILGDNQYTYTVTGTAGTGSSWYTINSDQITHICGDYETNFSMGYEPLDKKRIVRDHIHKLLSSNEQKSRNKFGITLTPEEMRARQTLREIITEADWRKYLTNGFVMVKGQSGKFYQVFISHQERIRVYEKGKHTMNLCIHTDSQCPPTDHVINMKTLIECDEDAIYTLSNKTVIGGNMSYGGLLSGGLTINNGKKPDNIVELWNSIKSA